MTMKPKPIGRVGFFRCAFSPVQNRYRTWLNFASNLAIKTHKPTPSWLRNLVFRASANYVNLKLKCSPVKSLPPWASGQRRQSAGTQALLRRAPSSPSFLLQLPGTPQAQPPLSSLTVFLRNERPSHQVFREPTQREISRAGVFLGSTPVGRTKLAERLGWDTANRGSQLTSRGPVEPKGPVGVSASPLGPV